MTTKQGDRPKAATVDAFMAALDHPRKTAIEALRVVIRAVDPRIRESVKWNAPSYALAEHFVTFKLRPVETVQLVLHTGAKPRPHAAPMVIDDPVGLLRWVAPDRALATFTDLDDVRAKQAALSAILREWIAQLEG